MINSNQKILINLIASTVYSNGDIPLECVLETWVYGWLSGDQPTPEKIQQHVKDFFDHFLELREIFENYTKIYPSKGDAPVISVPKVLLENKKGESHPLMTTIQTMALDIRKLFPYVMEVDSCTFTKLMLQKIPKCLDPKFSRQGKKIIIQFNWIRAQIEQTQILPESLLAMILGSQKAQGVVSADATFSNLLFTIILSISTRITDKSNKIPYTCFLLRYRPSTRL